LIALRGRRRIGLTASRTLANTLVQQPKKPWRRRHGTSSLLRHDQETAPMINDVLLIDDSPPWSQEIVAYWRQTLRRPIQRGRLEAADPNLWPGLVSTLILACHRPEEAGRVRELVQEVCLRQLPVTIVLVEGGPDAPLPGLDGLESYVAARLTWPHDASALARTASTSSANGCQSKSEPSHPRADIRRRLAALAPSLALLADDVALAAARDLHLLLSGETGTGKTFVAALIHEFSPRSSHPLVVVPCGALSESLMESELFGHTKGAFTGADQPKKGKLAGAGKGTLLLDEIDALGLGQQAKLLRVLETGEYEPLGSNETLNCQARIMAASNVNLEAAMRAGRFRSDLYYRLHGLALHLQPLRKRTEDIAPLTRAMAARFAAKFGKELFAISPEAMATLEGYPWPGNIRQLQNVVLQAVLVSRGPVLLLSDLPEAVRQRKPSQAPSEGGSLGHNVELTEQAIIQRALARHGNTHRAAVALGISRFALYKKRKKYGLLPATNPRGRQPRRSASSGEMSRGQPNRAPSPT
jgi:DNA-binding NtrC family response regulator